MAVGAALAPEAHNLVAVAVASALVLWGARLVDGFLRLARLCEAFSAGRLVRAPRPEADMRLVRRLRPWHLRAALFGGGPGTESALRAADMRAVDVPFDASARAVILLPVFTETPTYCLALSFEAACAGSVQVFWGVRCEELGGAVAPPPDPDPEPSASPAPRLGKHGYEPLELSRDESGGVELVDLAGDAGAGAAAEAEPEPEGSDEEAPRSGGAERFFTRAGAWDACSRPTPFEAGTVHFSTSPEDSLDDDSVLRAHADGYWTFVVAISPAAAAEGSSALLLVGDIAGGALADGATPTVHHRLVYELPRRGVFELQEVFDRDGECVVCLENPKQTILLPCRHCCACDDCFARLEACPVCRAPYEGYVSLPSPSAEGGAGLVGLVGSEGEGEGLVEEKKGEGEVEVEVGVEEKAADEPRRRANSYQSLSDRPAPPLPPPPSAAARRRAASDS